VDQGETIEIIKIIIRREPDSSQVSLHWIFIIKISSKKNQNLGKKKQISIELNIKSVIFRLQFCLRAKENRKNIEK
jgi:hypothetical protein